MIQSYNDEKLSEQFRGALRTFAYWMAAGTVGKSEGILDGIARDDYLIIFNEPSAFEQAFAIFTNVIEIDKEGKVLNSKYAEKRAAQYIRSYLDSSYDVIPPFEDWELILY